MKLIVLNLPRSLTEMDLEAKFKAYGNVTASNLVKDDETDTSKGFGFVEMATEEGALRAIEELHGKKIGGRKIRVRPANKDTSENQVQTPEPEQDQDQEQDQEQEQEQDQDQDQDQENDSSDSP